MAFKSILSDVTAKTTIDTKTTPNATKTAKGRCKDGMNQQLTSELANKLDILATDYYCTIGLQRNVLVNGALETLEMHSSLLPNGGRLRSMIETVEHKKQEKDNGR